jgi:hypothetical protein
MHIRKSFAVLSVVILWGSGSVIAQRADNDMQARARAALDAALTETNAAPAPAAPPAPAPKPAAAPKPVAPTPPPVAVAPYTLQYHPFMTAAPTPPPVAVAPPPPVVRAAPAAPVAQPPPVQQPAPAPATPPPVFTYYSSAPSADAQARALDALHASEAQLEQSSASTPPPAAPPQAPIEPQPATPSPAVTSPAAPIPPLVSPAPAPTVASSKPAPVAPAAPATPATVPTATWPKAEAAAAPADGLNSSKEQKLQALLDEYKADKITPYEYHTQRAKILSEP